MNKCRILKSLHLGQETGRTVGRTDCRGELGTSLVREWTMRGGHRDNRILALLIWS